MNDIKDTKVYTISDYVNWDNLGEIKLSPKYQRNTVWNLKAKSYFMDSIIRGYPVPQIFIRQMIDVSLKKTYREVIDGQQRLTAIFGFIENKFEILKSHNSEYGGKTYSQLPEDIQEKILSYNLSTEIIKIKDDSLIYNMFARLNTNGYKLNNQELRNAQYWGEFKVCSYELSKQLTHFFLENKIFTDNDLSRMNEVEFVTSLIISTLDGIVTETPSIVDGYYKKYDDSFERRSEIEKKIIEIIEIIENIYTDISLSNSVFKKKTYFYTLFNAVKKIKGEEESINIDLLKVKLNQFESEFSKYLNKEIYDTHKLQLFADFEKNHRSRTTNKSEREDRVETLYNYILGE